MKKQLELIKAQLKTSTWVIGNRGFWYRRFLVCRELKKKRNDFSDLFEKFGTQAEATDDGGHYQGEAQVGPLLIFD